MTTPYRFGKYTLRRTTEDDYELARAWIMADPSHAGRTPPKFFLTQSKGIESYVLEDPEGPVFFFRMTRAVRIDIQFAPDEEHERTREGLIRGLDWLSTVLAEKGIRQLIFESVNLPLIRMAEKRLGFHRSHDELVKDLQPAEETAPQERAVEQQGVS